MWDKWAEGSVGREKSTGRWLHAMWEACDIEQTRACGPESYVCAVAGTGTFGNTFVRDASCGIITPTLCAEAEATMEVQGLGLGATIRQQRGRGSVMETANCEACVVVENWQGGIKSC